MKLKLSLGTALKKYFKKSVLNPIVISGVFGNDFSNLFQSPTGYRSIMFSNNSNLKHVAELKGWEFRLLTLDGMKLTNDPIVSAVQSKYIKFLMFTNDFPEYFLGSPVIYIDHKVELKKEHITLIQKMISPEKSILIRNTPRLKSTISDEIEDAMHQSRYRESMPETIRWLEMIKEKRGISETVRIMNTGLIYYKNVNSIRPLLNEVHQAIKTLNQPECQIIWAALSQPFENMIQRVDWSEIGIDHKVP